MHPIVLKSWPNSKSCDLTLLLLDLSETSLETIHFTKHQNDYRNMISFFGSIQMELYYIWLHWITKIMQKNAKQSAHRRKKKVMHRKPKYLLDP